MHVELTLRECSAHNIRIVIGKKTTEKLILCAYKLHIKSEAKMNADIMDPNHKISIRFSGTECRV